jgi:hypothetical protein
MKYSFLLLLNLFLVCDVQTCDQYILYRYEHSKNWSFLLNFNNFKQLSLECINKTLNTTSFIGILPNQPILLDDSFKLGNIFGKFQLHLIEFIYVGNLNGIDLNSKPFLNT